MVTGPPVAEAVQALRTAGLRVLAADGGAHRTLDDLQAEGTLGSGTGWLFGNEAWGLPADIRALADDIVAVPIYGRAESLNLAAAAAVCLYSSARAARPAFRAPPGGRKPGRAVTCCEQLARGAAAARRAGARV